MMTLEEKIKNKNILFFSVQSFNLEKEIKAKLESYGARVVFYDERPANNNFTKGIIRLKRSLYQSRIDNYYKLILERTRDIVFDFLLVSRGEVVPAFFLEALKKNNPDCEFIYNNWDSFTNLTRPTTILKYFDRKLSFDPIDATKYKISFRPLFFLDVYKNIKTDASNNDILFLGTAHSDRYKISSEVKEWATRNNFNMFCYYYMHGRLVYFYKRLFDKTFKQFDYRKLSFKSLSTKDIVKLYQDSKVILDINHPLQKGLTMRTFEAIGSKRKLITTNPEIRKYPFYNPQNIYIIDRNNVVLAKDFFTTPYQDIDEHVYNKLTMEGWLYNLFVDDEAAFWDKYR
jgi:hypothetical protein